MQHRPYTHEHTPYFPEDVWSGFAAEYRDLMRDVTEAPPAFHMASLLTATGCLMGRDVAMMSGRATYGNLYTLLIGETSMARKTTAIQFACDLATDAARKLGVQIKPLFGIASAEGLAANMMENDGVTPRVLAIEDEFRSLLKKSQQKGVSNLIPRLTEAYNHLPAFEVNTRTDRLTANGFFLSMAAASTPEWFADSLTDLDIAGGFLNRWCIFSGCGERPIPRPDPVNERRWNDLADRLAASVSCAKGVRSLSKAAGAKYDDFYIRHWNAPREGDAGSAAARMTLHAVKFALILSVLERHANVEADDVERGIALAEHCAEQAAAVAEDVGKARTHILQDKLLKALKDYAQTSSVLMQNLHISAEDLNRVGKALEYAGMIEIFREATGGRRRVVYRLAA